MPPLAVMFTFSVPPEKIDDAIAILAEISAAMTIEEPAALMHVSHQRADKPGSFAFYELYPDEAAFKAHGRGPIMKAAGSRLNALMEQPGKGFILNPVAGVGLPT
ncbi:MULTISPECIES: putative quinol monooxygenase [unclassified Frankia]|uniref:putative quinol monooxygenase n=1 Tax=unclassified Frankia TaxID=2632575 RepID=UPI002AD3E8F6|nr:MULTISPECIES: antibiotic biosynthesis monooxygenase [unclassified Frankia]